MLGTRLYSKYGNRVTTATTEILYDRILADPQLAPFFEGVDIDRLREHMSDILSMIIGGPDLYQGRDLKEAHAAYKIRMDDFNRVAAHLAASLSIAGVEDEDVTKIMAEVAKSAPLVVTA